MTEIFLPTLHTFENKNVFTGSCGPLRFKLTPKPDEGIITAEIWHGIFCYEKSTVEEVRDFPLTAEGREDLRAYLTASV